ncbi:MAG: hypothetical protein P1S46_06080 [bacterium]|nr:hypothetical protein [bacterium]MDT8395585.1 hypothetical protein [bacterium]
MAQLSGKKGRELLQEVLDQLRTIDPRIVPFDSQEVEDLELAVSQSVSDVFGSESPEHDAFEQFKISAGPLSRADSKTEKQSKYEMGVPKAITRLEELLELMDRIDDEPDLIQEISSEDLVEVKQSPPKERAKAVKAPLKEAPKPAPSQASKTVAEKPAPSPPGAPQSAPQKPASTQNQPGKVLIISGAGEAITPSVEQLLGRLGISIEVPGQDPSALSMESLASVDHIAFTLLILAVGQRGGLSGLTSVIGMGKSKHELAYKLGFFVGRLGPGAVTVLFEGERPGDLPEQLFGVRYIQYQEEGGWQIGLLKQLKANGFFIDANLLFE